MNVISLLKDIFEKFELGFKGLEGKYSEIYINPSDSELRRILKDGEKTYDIRHPGQLAIRFIADNRTKKFYAWFALAGDHAVVWRIINGEQVPVTPHKYLPGKGLHEPYLMLGDIELHKGKLYYMFDSSHNHQEWDWVDQYIPITGENKLLGNKAVYGR